MEMTRHRAKKRSGSQEGDLEAGLRLGAFWKDLFGGI